VRVVRDVKEYRVDEQRPNGLLISRAAQMDRDCVLTDSNTQNRPDFVAAQRRPLQP